MGLLSLLSEEQGKQGIGESALLFPSPFRPSDLHFPLDLLPIYPLPMDLIFTGTQQAFWLLLSGDPEVWRITFLSLQISLSATFISLLLGIPLGAFLALKEFPGRRFVISLVNTGMSLP